MNTQLSLPKKRVPICAVCLEEILSVRVKCVDCKVSQKHQTQTKSGQKGSSSSSSSSSSLSTSNTVFDAGDGLDLCLQCLASGRENTENAPLHSRKHRYRILDNLASMHLLERDWSADEELQLLEGIEIYGLGNWRDISNYLGGSKSDINCARHYTRCYLESPTAPVPVPLQQQQQKQDLSAGDSSFSTLQSSDIEMSSSAAQSNSGANIAANTTRLRRKAGQSTSANLSDGGGLLSVLNGRDASGGSSSSSSSSASAPTLSIGASSSLSGATGGGVGTGAHLSATPGYSSAHVPRSDVVGYMPLRGDFDLEYDNDAEVVIADMDFQEGEHTTETELKLKILEIYNAKLDERERRKSFVIERGLLDYKRLLAIERRRPRDEREIYDAFRPFARFNTPQEHEDLVRGVILEQRLRKRIAQLQEYRRNGIRSLAEAHEYDVLKRKRDLTSSSSSAAAAIATKKQATSSSSSSFLDRKSGGAATSAAGSGGGGGGESQHATVAPASATDEKGRRSSAVGGKRKREESSSSAAATASSKAPFVVAGLPGANLLSDKEKSLCEALRLVPSQYQQIKATVVNIALARGYVKRSDAAGKLVHIDAAKIGGVYDFVVSCGWAAAPQLDEIEKTC